MGPSPSPSPSRAAPRPLTPWLLRWLWPFHGDGLHAPFATSSLSTSLGYLPTGLRGLDGEDDEDQTTNEGDAAKDPQQRQQQQQARQRQKQRRRTTPADRYYREHSGGQLLHRPEDGSENASQSRTGAASSLAAAAPAAAPAVPAADGCGSSPASGSPTRTPSTTGPGAPSASSARPSGESPKPASTKSSALPAPETSVPYRKLWRFATPHELVLLALGLLLAVTQGALQPISAVILGNVVNAFAPGADTLAIVSQNCVYYLILAAVAAVAGTTQMGLITYVSGRQADRVRRVYLRAVLRQEMAWFDQSHAGELTTRIASDVSIMQEGMGEKLGLVAQYMTTFVGGFVVGFIKSWKLTLVIMAAVPLLVGVAIGGSVVIARYTRRSQQAYAEAGTVAEEVVGAMRTVTAFGGQPLEAARYGAHVQAARRLNVRRGYIDGAATATHFLTLFGAYALSFWFSAKLISEGELTAGAMVTTFTSVLMGSNVFAQSSPSFAAMASARGAGKVIFATIDREPLIDSLSDAGARPDPAATAHADVEFRDIHFAYPTRPDIPVLRGVTLKVRAGQTVAVVGPSGCGKSTLLALLQRFYDPAHGAVCVGGRDIRELNVRWLRHQIGVVSQESVLFGLSIEENILLGADDGATHADVEAAARLANAHDFIRRMPAGYATPVGNSGGASLSGGQKQRIAIARAMVRNPHILLLDEATSALDSKSERVVQRAIERSSKGRTAIFVAHRLSTIQHCDVIVVMDRGLIVEQGSHHELMERAGLYAQLVRMQQVRAADGSEAPAATAAPADDPAAASADDMSDSDDDADAERAAAAAAATATATATTAVASVAAAGKSSTGPNKAAAAPLPKGGPPAPADPHAEVHPLTWPILKRAYRTNAPEWHMIVFGALGAAVAGAAFPTYSVVYSRALTQFLTETGQSLESAASFWAGIFVALGALMAAGSFLQGGLLSHSGERLTERLRRMLFAAIMRQDAAWFDDGEHSTGAVTTALATDAAQVQGLTGANLGVIAQLLGALTAGIVIAFTACWQLALAVLAAMPLMVVGMVVRAKVLMGSGNRTRLAYQESGKIASEVVENIRTVLALGREDTFQQTFADSLRAPNAEMYKSAWLGGLAYGVSQAMMLLIYCGAYYYGAHLILWGVITFQGMIQAIMAVLFAGIMIGRASTLAPDFSKGVVAAYNLFLLCDRVPAIDVDDARGDRPADADVAGRIALRQVHFHYPTRAEQQILRGLDVVVEPGTTVALVGASGCGKSTVLALLERFYDPTAGAVELDGHNVTTLNLQWLRHVIGLVAQTPVLFGTTIRDNIRYGRPDATMDEIEAAAREANAHTFIAALPAGYDTQVGERGTQLSGGQKQRIAIARALVRNPRILLLDEPTSALDSESEKVVQDALDRARLGRTTILISHRLSTVQNADEICVLDHGRVAERGTHQHLLALDGLYAALVRTQAVPL